MSYVSLSQILHLYYFKMKELDYCSQNIVIKSIGFTCPFVCDHANIDSDSTEVTTSHLNIDL